jgi:hypothetical protein
MTRAIGERPDRAVVLADAAFHALQLERSLVKVLAVERDDTRRTHWRAGLSVANKLRQLLLIERRRHLQRVKSNRQRARRRTEVGR